MFPTNKKNLLKHLENFSQNEILNYSSERNYDFGKPHNNVSKLSPFLRRRFISEEEILRIVLKNNDIKNIQKFIDEVFWRTYWRGWLEARPWVYSDYKRNKDNLLIPQKTGIKCFDHWKEELIDTGYLHNHSRMWFASIWIFTLGFSWQSGAKFFEDNLLDFCPASNTLSWRWVAGIQTIGKPYIARAENIKEFTKEKFYPQNQLKENLNLNFSNLSNGKALQFNGKKFQLSGDEENIGLILNKNDLSINHYFDEKSIKYSSCLYVTKHGKKLIEDFQNSLHQDICNNVDDITVTDNFEQIYEWLKDKKIKNLVIPYETIGNEIFTNKDFLKKLDLLNVNYKFFLRDWDFNAFPHCTKGFFNFKKIINELLTLANINQ